MDARAPTKDTTPKKYILMVRELLSEIIPIM